MPQNTRTPARPTSRTVSAVDERVQRLEHFVDVAFDDILERLDRLEESSEADTHSAACTCEYAQCSNHDQLVRLVRAETPTDVLELLTEALTWPDMMHEDLALDPRFWLDFRSYHAVPDAAMSTAVVKFAAENYRIYVEWQALNEAARSNANAVR